MTDDNSQFLEFTKTNGDKLTLHYSRIVGYEDISGVYTDLFFIFAGEEKIYRVKQRYGSVKTMLERAAKAPAI